jgi:hypothetical protein
MFRDSSGAQLELAANGRKAAQGQVMHDQKIIIRLQMCQTLRGHAGGIEMRHPFRSNTEGDPERECG